MSEASFPFLFLGGGDRSGRSFRPISPPVFPPPRGRHRRRKGQVQTGSLRPSFPSSLGLPPFLLLLRRASMSISTMSAETFSKPGLSRFPLSPLAFLPARRRERKRVSPPRPRGFIVMELMDQTRSSLTSRIPFPSSEDVIKGLYFSRIAGRRKTAYFSPCKDT